MEVGFKGAFLTGSVRINAGKEKHDELLENAQAKGSSMIKDGHAKHAYAYLYADHGKGESYGILLTDEDSKPLEQVEQRLRPDRDFYEKCEMEKLNPVDQRDLGILINDIVNQGRELITKLKELGMFKAINNYKQDN